MKQKNLLVTIDEDVWRALRKNAAVKGIVFSFYIRQLLAAATSEKGAKKESK